MSGMKALEPICFAEYEAMEKQDGLTYELIDGIVLMSPRPAVKHQRINGNLYFELRKLLDGKNCEPIQEVDLILEENHMVPDLMVVCNDALDGAHFDKPPMIVMEIISPSSGSRDYFVKRRKYGQLGISEYWIISPEEQCIMIIDYANDQEADYCEGTAVSFVMPDIQIELSKVFV